MMFLHERTAPSVPKLVKLVHTSSVRIRYLIKFVEKIFVHRYMGHIASNFGKFVSLEIISFT